jgi:dCMP deaminase
MTAQWTVRYLELAKHVATWSKDPSTKCGAVIIGSSCQVLSQGFNGFPRGIQDTPERLSCREVKYQFVVHAEMNAIYNASRTGTSLLNSSMYVYGLPVCSECAKGIVQVGICEVVMPRYEEVPQKWAESFKLSMQILKEGGVKVTLLDHSL